MKTPWRGQRECTEIRADRAAALMAQAVMMVGKYETKADAAAGKDEAEEEVGERIAYHRQTSSLLRVLNDELASKSHTNGDLVVPVEDNVRVEGTTGASSPIIAAEARTATTAITRLRDRGGRRPTDDEPSSTNEECFRRSVVDGTSNMPEMSRDNGGEIVAATLEENDNNDNCQSSNDSVASQVNAVANRLSRLLTTNLPNGGTATSC